MDKSITDKYNELSKKIGGGSLGNKYTITKEQLLGEWKDIAFSYIYKNGKLYLSDDGVVLQK